MKLHKRIWVKSDGITMDGGYKVREDNFSGSKQIEEVEPQPNVIVLTIEELKEVFHAGVIFQRDRDNAFTCSPGVKDYLTSKGITLP
jgi:trehalose utilization protein